MRTERLVCVHEQLYTHRKNQGPPQTRPRKLRSRIDLSHPGRGVRLPGCVHRQWNADCGANQLCARGRQIVSARLDGKPFDEDAGERRAFLPERYAPRRHRLLAQRDGPLGQLPICGGDGESGNRRRRSCKTRCHARLCRIRDSRPLGHRASSHRAGTKRHYGPFRSISGGFCQSAHGLCRK